MKSTRYLNIFILLSMLFLSPTHCLAQELISQPMSFEEWSRENPANENGKLKQDEISKLPEISTMFLIGKNDTFKPAIGIELFHKRHRPRTSKLKWEIHLADQEVGFGFGRIIVPIVNLTVGPYVSWNFKEKSKQVGIRFGIFKF